MESKAIYLFVIMVVSCLLAGGLVYWYYAATEAVPDEIQCNSESDCVPDSCCHAGNVVNKDYAPKCSDVLCTTECIERTLDCGQGRIKCINKRCVAIIK